MVICVTTSWGVGKGIVRGEKQIWNSRESLRVTLASIGDAVITTDTEGRITFLNTVAESLTGWKRTEAAGQPLDCVFRIINEQTRQPIEDPATRVLRDGLTVGLANHTILIAKDGTERPLGSRRESKRRTCPAAATRPGVKQECDGPEYRHCLRKYRPSW